jgi:hypothetical protein
MSQSSVGNLRNKLVKQFKEIKESEAASGGARSRGSKMSEELYGALGILTRRFGLSIATTKENVNVINGGFEVCATSLHEMCSLYYTFFIRARPANLIVQYPRLRPKIPLVCKNLRKLRPGESLLLRPSPPPR